LLFPAAETIRKRFAQGEFYLPELLVSLRATQASMCVIRKIVGDEIFATKDKVLVGSLGWKGFDLSRHIITSLLTTCGWDVTDLGGNLSPTAFADACAETHADVLVLVQLPISARHTAAVGRIAVDGLVLALESRGIRQRTRLLLVGCEPDKERHSFPGMDAICSEFGDVPSVVNLLVTAQWN
jgi:5-methyltetrahydrofolate--homocysteine methyltransferase